MDGENGKTYDIYDGNCLYDPETDHYSEPFESCPSERERTESCDDTFIVNGITYISKRCYRDGNGLASELEANGFNVLFQLQYSNYPINNFSPKRWTNTRRTSSCELPVPMSRVILFLSIGFTGATQYVVSGRETN